MQDHATTKRSSSYRRRAASALIWSVILGLVLVVTPSTAATASAGDLYTALDASRRQAGQPVLARDAGLQDVAQRWAAQLAVRGPDGLAHNPDLRSQVPAGWQAIAENVGYASSDGALHTAWMNSEGHRTNIVDGRFTNVGIGRVLSGGRVYGVQVFARYVGANARAGMVPDAPTGNLDAVAPARDGLTVSGWANDPKAAAASVHIYLDGRLAAAVRTGVARPDVQAALPAAGSSAGFSVQLRGVATGRRTVCAYAVSAANAGNPLLGCRTVTASRQSFGRLDDVSGVPGGVQLRGWALDPLADATKVHVYVDGRAAASVTTSTSRPDVAAAYRGYPTTAGFTATVAGLTPGRRTVCAYAISSAGGANPNLGCKQVDVRANPFGALDAVTSSSGRVTARGWTIDGSTPESNEVHLYVTDASGTRVGTATAERDRPDVAAAHPAYGAAHGYQLSVPVVPGAYRVCAYGIDTVAPGTNSLLGCRGVSVR